MSEENQQCPKCKSPYCYKDRNLWVCPECFNEWDQEEKTTNTHSDEYLETNSGPKFVDVNGLLLQSGDTVITVKDLKIGKDTIKSGTKVKNIRLLDNPQDGHDISCKIDGFGSIYLKSSVVKKSK